MGLPRHRGGIGVAVPLLRTPIAELLREAALDESYPLGATDVAVDGVVLTQDTLIYAVESFRPVGVDHAGEGISLRCSCRCHVRRLVTDLIDLQ